MVNQVGYLPHFSKFVFVSNSADSFFVKEAGTNNILYRGKLSLWKTNDPSTGLTIYKGDFSSFKQTGSYYITTSLGDSSYQFNISDNVYNESYNKMLKGFYYQRCGLFLLPQYTDLKYYHQACHLETDGEFHSTTGLTGKIVSTGGWHDAGDFGKYVVNAGISVGTLLMAYETFPLAFSQDDLNIPESGNKVPDILDEVKYELDWLFTMQNTDGGVFAKLTRKQFEGFVMPQTDQTQRYIYQVASTATADFAAMMARASRIFKQFDGVYAGYSQKCLDAAEKAWAFLEKNPGIVPAGGFKNPSDTGTGEYGDGNDSDERLWAAAELYIATGKDNYHTYFRSNYNKSGVFTSSMNWGNLRSMAHLTYLFGKQTSKVSTINNELYFALDSYCASLLDKRNNNGLHVVLDPNEYNWGSNSDVMNKAILLIMGYMQTNTAAFRDAALDQLNYILGVNGYAVSFVTGVGSKPPMKIHHRPSASDNIVDPVPGLMSGGPNKYLQDDALKKYFNSSTPAALCWIDNQDSYASNEICINWNAPLVFVAGYFNDYKSSTKVEEGHVTYPKDIFLEQNYPNPFNGQTAIRYNLNKAQEVEYRVYDVLGNQVLAKNLGVQSAGTHQFVWNSDDANGRILSSGIYYFFLKAGENFTTIKINLLK